MIKISVIRSNKIARIIEIQLINNDFENSISVEKILQRKISYYLVEYTLNVQYSFLNYNNNDLRKKFME